MFELRNLDIGYDKNLLVSRVNFTFKEGRIYTISGDNGIGKTTLLKSLVGLVSPISGNITINKESILDWDLRRTSKLFSILFSRQEIDSSIKVREIFEFSLSHLLPADKLQISIEKFLSYFNIEYLLNMPFGLLSDGQKQLVLIARALIKPATIYLLDEPTIYLDIKTKKLLIKYIKEELIGIDKLVILISHDADFVLNISDDQLQINNGVLNRI